jgi:multiple sugar transport system substrate-binding protein
MSRKLIVIALIVVTLLAGMVNVSAFAQDQVKVTITCRCVTDGVNAAEVTWIKEYVIPNFEQSMAAEGKNVTVELVEFGGSDEEQKQQFALDLGAGGGYDVMGFDGFWLPEFVSGELLKPLDQVAGDAVNQWDGWSHISPGIQAILSYQGQRYGIANGTDVREIFYRTDIFEQAGIAVPWQPTSWDDILATAQQLKDAGVESPIQLDAGTAMGEATTMQGWFMALLGAGEHMYDFDQQKWIVSSPAILDALNFYKTIYIDQKLGDARMQLVQDGRDQSFAAFASGQIAMLVEGDWFWRSAILNQMDQATRDSVVSWAKMPAEKPGMGYRGQDFVTISGGTGWILNPNTKSPDEAWALLAFMSGKDMQMEWEQLQPRINFRDDVPVAGDPVMSAMADALLPLTTVRPMLPDYAKISSEAQLMTERVVSGEMSPADAMQAYADAVTEIAGADNVLVIPTE